MRLCLALELQDDFEVVILCEIEPAGFCRGSLSEHLARLLPLLCQQLTIVLSQAR